MPAVSGSFSGNVKVQTALAVSDQSNHELNVAEISGTQKSTDEKWNNAKITYWGVTDIVEGKGSHHCYFDNDHGESGRDWGTVEGKSLLMGARSPSKVHGNSPVAMESSGGSPATARSDKVELAQASSGYQAGCV